MTSQLEFKPRPASRPRPKAEPREPEQGDVQALCRMLAGQGWRHAADLVAHAISDRFADDRYIRMCAEASDGQVISGQQGYRLADEGTQEERDRAKQWLRHQGWRMIGRADAIERREKENAAKAALAALT